MPTYVFKNKETDEIIEKFMSMSQREEFLKENPNMESVIGAPALVRDTPKLPGGFRDVLQKIHGSMPGSTLKDNIR
jgi:hypothetical protein